VLTWEICGMLFIIVLGSLLHFAFEWSGRWLPLGAVAAVNESVWEHLKLGFWPALLYAIIEHPWLGRAPNNFSVAKSAGICVIPAVIVGLFYSYTAVLGEHLLAADIAIFVVAVVAGQLVSYRLLRAAPLPRRLNLLAPVAVVLLGIAFVLFTYHPPALPIFRDSLTGGYGVGG